MPFLSSTLGRPYLSSLCPSASGSQYRVALGMLTYTQVTIASLVARALGTDENDLCGHLVLTVARDECANSFS